MRGVLLWGYFSNDSKDSKRLRTDPLQWLSLDSLFHNGQKHTRANLRWQALAWCLQKLQSMVVFPTVLSLLARIDQGSSQFLGPFFFLLLAIKVCVSFPFPFWNYTHLNLLSNVGSGRLESRYLNKGAVTGIQTWEWIL